MSQYAASGELGSEFGLIALRKRSIARVVVALGVAALAFLYTAPIAGAFVVNGPARVHALDALTIPTLRFPVLKTHVAPSAQTAGPAAPTHFFHTQHQNAVPAAHSATRLVHTGAIAARRNWIAPAALVSNRYGPAASSSPTPQSSAPADASTPVSSNVGGEPTGFDTAATQSADTPSSDTTATSVTPAPVATTAPATTAAATAHEHGDLDAADPASTDTAAASATTDPPAESAVTPPADTTEPASADPSTVADSPAPSSDAAATSTDPAATPAATDTSVDTTASSSDATATAPATSAAATSAPAVDTTAPAADPAPAATTPAASTTVAPAPLSLSGTDVALASDGTSLTVTVDGATTTQLLDGISSVQVASSTLTIDAAEGAIAAPIAFDGASLVIVNSPTASDWTVNGDGTGSVAGGGVTSITFTHVTHLSGGGSADTLHGPAADSAWTIDGANAGSVGGVAFTGFENLAGAPNNKDTFTLAPGGSVSGLVDGGDGGFDSLVVSGQRGSVVSNPSGPHSGTLLLDGAKLAYAGLEPIDVSGTDIVYNGADIGGSTEVLDKDLIQVAPGTAAGTIQIRDCLIVGCTGSGAGSFPPDQAEVHTFTIAGTHSLTINGGLGGDTVEFTGDYLVPGSSLTVNAEHIKVDSGVTINVGTAVGNDINFNAVYKDNGLSLLGLTTTIPVPRRRRPCRHQQRVAHRQQAQPDRLVGEPEHDGQRCPHRISRAAT